MNSRRTMKVDDFLLVMKRNRGIYPEFEALPEEQKRYLANLNICTGTAETFLDEEGEIIGVGGVRYLGIGEAWFITLPGKRRPFMLRTVLENFTRIRDSKNLWRIYAESRISNLFLEHLEFNEQKGIYIWTRS